MSDEQHTPGPWHVTIGCRIQSSERNVAGRNMSIAIAAGEGSSYPATVNEANARLIAASPELLATCERLLIWRQKKTPQEAIDAARAAIAKAKNNAPD